LETVNNPVDESIAIVGAGLAGTLMACFLGQAGKQVALFERRPDPRQQGQERGRSINLALSTRGLHALQQVGLANEVLCDSVRMRGRMIHSWEGSLVFQPYGRGNEEVLHSVSRAGLNLLLVEAAARHPSVHMVFGQRCIGMDFEKRELEFLQNASKSIHKVKAKTVIGADGAYSALRLALQKRERGRFSQEYLDHGYRELTIPSGPGGKFQMEPNALHIWPRGNFMMIALPNADGSFTCTLFWPFEGRNSFAALTTEAEVLAYFNDQFPDVPALIPTLAHDFLNNATGALVTTRCHPWHFEDRIVLVGDACHAVVPFLGQGMNAAFEDCSVLDNCLTRHGADRAAAFAE
jgi:kynurenine 3-monooxygenase